MIFCHYRADTDDRDVYSNHTKEGAPWKFYQIEIIVAMLSPAALMPPPAVPRYACPGTPAGALLRDRPVVVNVRWKPKKRARPQPLTAPTTEEDPFEDMNDAALAATFAQNFG